MIETLMDSLSRYYGLDWVSFAFGLTGMFLITRKHKAGFVLSAIAYVAGIGAAILSQQFGFIAYNLALIVIMAQGFRDWKADPEMP